MQDVTRKLHLVRRLARGMLLTQRLMHWLAAMMVCGLVCGLMDYALRLPGGFRLAVGVTVGVASVGWLVGRGYQAWLFRPPLTDLALRVEKLYPGLAGVLASSVELAGSSGAAGALSRTGMMAQASIQRAQHKARGVAVSQVIRPMPVLRSLLIAVAVLLVVGSVVVVAPRASRMAAARWLMPLGAAQWPRRTRVDNLVRMKVWPSDVPVLLRARVSRGYHQGMRTWATYRVVHADGSAQPWQSLLMNEQDSHVELADGERGLAPLPSVESPEVSDQTAGVFERLLEAPLVAEMPSGTAPVKVEFYFESGDDRTRPRVVQIVSRPSVVSVKATITPPAYARGLVSDQEVQWREENGSIATVNAWKGSRVAIRVIFNKTIPLDSARWDEAFPGLPPSMRSDADAVITPIAAPHNPHAAVGLSASWVLNQTVQTPVRITDEFGLQNLSDQNYRIEVVTDSTPAVSMVQPATDLMLLPTAEVGLEALAQDDVAVESLSLMAQPLAELEERDASGGDPGAEPGADVDPPGGVLARVSGRRAAMRVEHVLDLQPLGLTPGDEWVLTAEARDVFDLEGQRHDPVVSSPRRLRVIDRTTFARQIRAELVQLRRQADRLQAQQQELLTRPAHQLFHPQQRLTQRLEQQAGHLAAVQQRISRNRYDDPPLQDLTRRADQLLSRAGRSSQQAAGHLEPIPPPGQAPPRDPPQQAEARQAQQQVQQALAELVNLLDQGRDALALQIQLQQLRALQEALATDVRQVLPRTLGQRPDQMAPEDRQALAEIAGRQADLAQQAQELIQQMQVTAELLSRDEGHAQNQALAQALSQAAAVAGRQGLRQRMRGGEEKVRQNQLASAGQDQQAALDAMQQMLSELANVDQHRQAILRRRLVQLVEAIRKLESQQEAQLDRLTNNAPWQALHEPLAGLRRNTLAVAVQAKDQKATTPAAESLDQAAAAQSQAVLALRATQTDAAAQQERFALDHLRQALQRVEQLQQQAQAQQMQDQRQKLRQQYIQLAQQQDRLRDETVVLSDLPRVTRAQRAELIDLGHREADVNVEARKLQRQVGQSVVFTRLHRRIDRMASDATTRLRAAHADQAVLAQQQDIADMLRNMAAALAETPEDQPPFAGQQGGGGGQGSGDAPLVPPLAELKLLRGWQQAVHDQTRELEGQTQPLGGSDRRQSSLRRLATQQRDLADLGETLIQQLSNPPPGGGPSTLR